MSHPEQIGAFSHSVNEHGCVIEHSAWKPFRLGDDGRCCGRKTHPYQKALSAGPGSVCLRCGREYGTSGEQRPNYAYKLGGDGNFQRDEPKGPVSQ